MVQQEINCCLSSLVSSLAMGYGCSIGGDGRGNGRLKDLESLCEQAGHLAAPIPDYEDAAIQAGFSRCNDGTWERPNPNSHHDLQDGLIAEDDLQFDMYDSAQEACEAHDIEPYDREVYEHWAVSQWLANKLIEQREKVDTDFAGLNVWARTTTGQAISQDGVIERIYQAMMAPA